MTLPEISKILLEIPLYEKVKFRDDDDWDTIYELIFFEKTIDAFCTSCEKQTTFKGIQDTSSHNRLFATQAGAPRIRQGITFKSRMINRMHQVDLICTRKSEHKMQFSFLIEEEHFLKIGQYPSMADLSQPDLRKYRNVLSLEKYKELNRGVGLITHGVGIGAFVYLRRIFEDLIEEAHQKNLLKAGWNDENYKRSKMEQKIDLLKSELPEFLTTHKALYSILSLGIHELSEEICLESFETVKLGIELILDEKLEKKLREEKIILASKSINKLNMDLERK